eukprot:TRINITY_DN1770_c0_g1_i18.p2 TRINITY_DN1770_c0_g1~~TRINITY_DN1770_c0_g1_i18.p2  ORF type:complete len:147 (+),score=35.93 TRINITY_DN1770_c0_g1_i18:1678-2118(+)
MRALSSSGSSKGGSDGKATVQLGSIGQQLNGLAMKWNPKEVDPPYVEALASVFSASVMRKQTATVKKKTAQKGTVEKSQASSAPMSSIKEALKRGVNYEGLVADKGLEAKVQETGKWLQKILDKEQDSRTDQENSTLAALINKVFK